MTQTALGTIDPSTMSGTDLAALLTAFGLAIESGNSGTSRPSYLTQGGLWLDTSVSGVVTLKLFLGSTDVVICNVSTSTGVATFPAISFSGLVPTSRNIATANSLIGGGNLTADHILQLSGDTATPGANKVYGTDGSGARGWRDFITPTTPHLALQLGAWNAPGTYYWTVPANVVGLLAYVGGAGGTDGAGGGITANLNITPGETLTILVGTGAAYTGSPSHDAAQNSGLPGFVIAGGGGETWVASGIYAPGVSPYAPGAAPYTFTDGSGGEVFVNGGNGIVVLQWVINT